MSVESVAIVIVGLIVAVVWLILRKKPNSIEKPFVAPPKWTSFLERKVSFYQKLNTESKARFENDIFQFLTETQITGVQTDVTLEDRLLVASSAVIPLFGFEAWNYRFLDEVILYPGPFDRNFQFNNPDEIITGMVGNGPMEGKMILSKPSLHLGFENDNDKRNVGIHEFVHLLDKENGHIDGIPPGFEADGFTLPWIDLIHEKTERIVANISDIDGYAATNRQEFLAVASEYFFERPHLLKKKHPKLYDSLVQVFEQDLAAQPKVKNVPKREIGRNDPCPCGSGLKYKKCCLI